jgi:hypothetical protein
MPFNSNSLMGLLIVSIGLLGVIVSLLITERKRFLAALALSGLIVVTGAYHYVSLSVRQWRVSKRLSRLENQQRINIQEIQERLRQQNSQSPVRPPATERPRETPARK